MIYLNINVKFKKYQMQIPFSKYQGLGNDFIVVQANSFPPDFQAFAELSKRLCQRHFGVGADGLMVAVESPSADMEMRIWNADGSQPEMCGNGLRCFVQYLADQQLISTQVCQIQTGAGLLQATRHGEQEISINMGQPILNPSDIPFEHPSDTPLVTHQLSCQNQLFEITPVSMGNPHCVIFVPELSGFDFDHWGPLLESHPLFPNKTNVEFVEVLSKKHAKVKVWERGVGPTLACGTGACAVLVAGVLNGHLSNEATIELPGGPLNITWKNKKEIMMRGPAQRVFDGKFELEETR